MEGFERPPRRGTGRRGLLLCLVPIATVLLLCGIFAAQYFCDNRYRQAYGVSDGKVLVESRLLARGGYLTQGWSLYRGLIAPEEIAAAAPVAVGVRIGDEGNFYAYDGDPGGEMTYLLELSGGEGSLAALRLPEVFSAARVFADGRELGATGDVDAGRARVEYATYLFPLQGQTRLVIQTFNRAHYYSGLYTPPLLAAASTAERAAVARAALYTSLAAFILAAVAVTLPFWGGDRRHRFRQLPFAALAVCAAVKLLHPLVFSVGTGVPELFCWIEDAASALLLVFAALLVGRMGGAAKSRLFGCAVLPLSLDYAITVMALSPLLRFLPTFLPAYGILVTAAKTLIGVLLAALSGREFARALRKGDLSLPAALAFSAALGLAVSAIFSAASIGFYEPGVGLWFEEAGGVAATLLFAVRMIFAERGAVRENAALSLRLKEEVDKKTRAVDALLADRRRLFKTMAHDLKSPLAAAVSYCEMLRDATSGAELEKGVAAISQRLTDYLERFRLLEEYEGGEAPLPVPLTLNGVVGDFYRRNLPDVELMGARFVCRIAREPLEILGSREQLDRVLENLVYNALDFLGERGLIRLSLDRLGRNAVLRVSDNGAGIDEDALPFLFEPYFSRRGGGQDRGLGLYIVRQIVLEHGGSVEARSRKGRGTTFTILLPLAGAAARSIEEGNV